MRGIKCLILDAAYADRMIRADNSPVPLKVILNSCEYRAWEMNTRQKRRIEFFMV
jgi:hypothetical protein